MKYRFTKAAFIDGIYYERDQVIEADKQPPHTVKVDDEKKTAASISET